MRIRKPLVVSAFAMATLFVTGCTGPVQSASVGDGSLGLQGASVTVPLTVKCKAGFNIAFLDAAVAQADGDKLAQGSGTVANAFPGVPCAGKAQTVTIAVFNTSPWVFREGAAAGRGDVTVFNPLTNELITTAIAEREIRIIESDPAPNPTKSLQRTPDPRYGRG